MSSHLDEHQMDEHHMDEHQMDEHQMDECPVRRTPLRRMRVLELLLFKEREWGKISVHASRHCLHVSSIRLIGFWSIGCSFTFRPSGVRLSGYSSIWCSSIWCSSKWCSSIWCSSKWYATISLCSTTKDEQSMNWGWISLCSTTKMNKVWTEAGSVYVPME